MGWSPGARVGRYEIVRELGRGGMGEVYLARDTELDRPVALKVVLEGVDDPESELRLRREAEVLARVEHPHLLRVFSCERIDGRALIVSEFVEGETLADYVGRQGTLGASEAAELMRDVADAVAAAHAAGVLHRDLKPENVMRSELGVKVMDFGLAFDARAERLTQTGVSMGTPGYMAPESLGAGPPDPRTDVFGLGATLYFLLCGKPPFGGAPLKALEAAARGAFSGVRERAPAVPAWLAEVCERALAPDPEDRQESALAFAAALAAGPPVQSPWGLAGASVALALFGVTALIGALVVRGEPGPAAPSRVDSSPPAVEVAQRAPVQQPAVAAFDGWPTAPELNDVAEIYEPWSFSRVEDGLAVLTRNPARPEFVLPLGCRRDSDWSVEVELSDLGLEPRGTVRLLLSADAEHGHRGASWSLERVDDGLEVRLGVGRGEPKRGREALDVDPRGPLSLALSRRGDVLALRVRGRTRELAELTTRFEADEAPAGQLRLRLGSQIQSQFEPSRGAGRGGLNYYGGRVAYTIRALRVRGAGLTLDDATTEHYGNIGRVGWSYVEGTDLAETLETVEAWSEFRGGINEYRFALYLLSLHEARLGRDDVAVNKLGLLHTTTRQLRDEGGLQAMGWFKVVFYVRNRVLSDLVHYPTSYRAAIADAPGELVFPFEKALRMARDGRQPEKQSWWCEKNAVQHRSDWGWVQAAMHLDPERDDLEALEILYRAKLYEEAWAKLAGRDPDAERDLVLEGELAFGLGKHAEALRRWEQVPPGQRKRIPKAKLALARRYPSDAK